MLVLHPAPPPCMQTHRGMPRCVQTPRLTSLLRWPRAHPFIHQAFLQHLLYASCRDLCLACDNNLSQPLRKLQFSRKTAQNRPPSGLWATRSIQLPAGHICLGSALHPAPPHILQERISSPPTSLLGPSTTSPSSSPHPTLQAPSWQVHRISWLPTSTFPGHPGTGTVRNLSPFPPASRLPLPTQPWPSCWGAPSEHVFVWDRLSWSLILREGAVVWWDCPMPGGRWSQTGEPVAPASLQREMESLSILEMPSGVHVLREHTPCPPKFDSAELCWAQETGGA